MQEPVEISINLDRKLCEILIYPLDLVILFHHSREKVRPCRYETAQRLTEVIILEAVFPIARHVDVPVGNRLDVA